MSRQFRSLRTKADNAMNTIKDKIDDRVHQGRHLEISGPSQQQAASFNVVGSQSQPIFISSTQDQQPHSLQNSQQNPNMSATERFSRGIELVKIATEHDRLGQFEDALRTYVAAIEALVEDVKIEKDANTRELVTSKIEMYMKRSEEIKQIVNAMKSQNQQQQHQQPQPTLESPMFPRIPKTPVSQPENNEHERLANQLDSISLYPKIQQSNQDHNQFQMEQHQHQQHQPHSQQPQTQFAFQQPLHQQPDYLNPVPFFAEPHKNQPQPQPQSQSQSQPQPQHHQDLSHQQQIHPEPIPFHLPPHQQQTQQTQPTQPPEPKPQPETTQQTHQPSYVIQQPYTPPQPDKTIPVPEFVPPSPDFGVSHVVPTPRQPTITVEKPKETVNSVPTPPTIQIPTHIPSTKPQPTQPTQTSQPIQSQTQTQPKPLSNQSKFQQQLQLQLQQRINHQQPPSQASSKLSVVENRSRSQSNPHSAASVQKRAVEFPTSKDSEITSYESEDKTKVNNMMAKELAERKKQLEQKRQQQQNTTTS